MDLSRWSGRIGRLRAFAADLVGASGGPPRSHPGRIGLLCLIDLVQDADLILPIAQAARANGACEPRIVMTDWLDRIAPNVAQRVAAAGFTPVRHARDAVLTGLAPELGPWDALLSASESTAASHRFAHALTKRAKAAGLTTFTLQHGLENVGLTYRGDGDHDFASDWIFCWGDPAALPDWVSADVRTRCIGVGRGALAPARDVAPLANEERPVVAVFENLHWARYDESYRRRFIDDLTFAAQARPDLRFIVRPHPAGLYLLSEAAAARFSDNVTIADPRAGVWADANATDLIAAAACVITTPSTIALDTAQIGRRVAVAAYDLDLKAYQPLPLLTRAADWIAFLDAPPDAAALSSFARRHVLEGDACAAMTESIAAHVGSRVGLERLSLPVRAVAKVVRIVRALPPLARFGLDGTREYRRWIAAYDTLTNADRDAIRQRCGALDAVSIVLDARGAKADAVARTRASLAAQLFAAHDIVVVGEGGAADLRAALAQARGRHGAIVRAGDCIAEHALFVLASQINEHPKALFAYSDEDELDAMGRRRAPFFKPDWDRDLFIAQDYACRLAVFDLDAARAAGGDSAYELLARMAARTPERPILHAPRVLYHRRRPLEIEAQAVRAAQELAGDACSVEAVGATRRGRWRIAGPSPLVSLIVPTRDRLALLRDCVDGLLNSTAYAPLELIIVDNDSREAETLSYLAEVARDERVRVIRDDGAFNFARLNNAAAAVARGGVLGMINNDIAVLEPHWLTEMAGHAMRPDVGAVGALLLYPNGRIQHAGCTLGVGGVAAHVYSGLPEDFEGPGQRLRVAHQVSAVTGACLLTRADVWRMAGGLDEDLPVAYNDVDYCLRLRRAGLHIIWTPHARLEHRESASRGQDVSGARRARLERDKALMRGRWGSALLNDPFYNPNLTLARIDAALAFPPRLISPWRAT